jgi:CheY-like chemotaxis protein
LPIVLLVDDANHRRRIGALLADQYRVAEAGSGAQALARLGEAAPIPW